MMDSGNGSKELPSGSLCRNGCGFYGSAATEGMCSKCYKDYLRKKQSSPVQAATALASHPVTVSANLSNSSPSSDPSPIVTSDSTSTASSLASTTTGTPTISNAANERVQPPIEEEGAAAKTPDTTSSTSEDSCPSPATSGDSPDGSEKGKKKKNRCTTCRKKVGLTGFECRCGGLFCSIHRYSDKHECSFDYRSHGQEEIRKNNPIVVGEKIKKL